MNRLALGTAQFGLNYGIANKEGQIMQSVAMAMLQLLTHHGINMLDTAVSYGESETCLGKIGVEKFKVITKLPFIPDICSSVNDWIFAQVNASLARLKIKKLYGLLLHHPSQLLGKYGQSIYKALLELKESGKVQKIGISIYNPHELNELISKYKFDLIQTPFNLIDCRLHRTGWLQRLKDMEVEIHCRSVFLQGLLLMNRDKISSEFVQWTSLWNKWGDWLLCNNISAVRACLMFTLSFPEIDRIVVGVDNVEQLEEIINALEIKESIKFPDLSCNDESLINPSRWSSLVG